MSLYKKFIAIADQIRDIPLLGMRLILAYGFYHPAMEKWGNMEATIMWFGNKEWGLGLPFPELQAYMAASAEFMGVWLLLFGLGTRLISIPLIFTMIMAYFTVHIGHGWEVIGQANLDPAVAERIGAAKEILKEYGDYGWLTESGSFVILKNGSELVVTYMVMLLGLVTIGPGRLSVDHIIGKKMNK